MSIRTLYILLPLLLVAQDKPREPEFTMAELKAKLTQTEKERDDLKKTTSDQAKLLQAYYGKFVACDTELTQLKALGPAQTK